MSTPLKATRSKQKFDAAFKRHALELWLASGRSAPEIARELGIKPSRLYAWKELFEAAGPSGQTTPADLAAENAALRRENLLLRQQRDILKKTLGILSDPLPSATNALTR